MKVITVGIVEDIREIREGLMTLVNGSEGFSCTQGYGSAEEAIGALPGQPVDVLLLDIHLPAMNGIECLKQLTRVCPGTLYIMSTVYEDDEHLFESLKAGAKGYLLKKTSASGILDAIRDVVNGGSPMSSQIARRVIDSFSRRDGIDAAESLTQKEKEVLRALSRGLRYKEIAADMNISVETVRTHARHIYEKLQVQSRMEAVNKISGRG